MASAVITSNPNGRVTRFAFATGRTTSIYKHIYKIEWDRVWDFWSKHLGIIIRSGPMNKRPDHKHTTHKYTNINLIGWLMVALHYCIASERSHLRNATVCRWWRWPLFDTQQTLSGAVMFVQHWFPFYISRRRKNKIKKKTEQHHLLKVYRMLNIYFERERE